jgi:hypothetical protein
VLADACVDLVQCCQALLRKREVGSSLDGALEGGRQHRDSQRGATAVLQVQNMQQLLMSSHKQVILCTSCYYLISSLIAKCMGSN